MEEAIVLYPTPAIGHLISMVELGKLILTQKPSFAVHVLVPHSPYNAGSIDSYIAAVSSVTFHRLPAVSLPPAASHHHELLILETLRLNNPNVRRFLLSLSETYTVRALFLDFFCIDALHVAAELGIPPLYFFTSAAGSLSLTLRLPGIHEVIAGTDRDGLDSLKFDCPGIPRVPYWDLPKPFQDPKDRTAQLFCECAKLMQKSAGIVVNTFETLESRTMGAFSDEPTPPVYAIGPLITSGGGVLAADCLTWLDSQPRQSVVFLCFGSLGVFSKEQLEAVAIGLEKSGHRFLWVVRNPPSGKDQNVDISDTEDLNLESLLPDGFLERNKDKGFVVKNWAPQVAVLNHGSVGGFVTHSGWNSVLEAVCAGVPMVSWPLYAEQRMNRILLAEEMKIAFPMEEGEGGFVSADEVEKRVKQVMDSEEGESIRERVGAMKREAVVALEKGGSSRVALSKLIEFINLEYYQYH